MVDRVLLIVSETQLKEAFFRVCNGVPVEVVIDELKQASGVARGD